MEQMKKMPLEGIRVVELADGRLFISTVMIH